MGSIIVGLLLLGIVAIIIWKLRSDRKKGKSSCGGTCGGCPNASHCHPQMTRKK
ncbi:MAG: FeoB-associated Cys-rich membrane protein [Oscillospiraceae bacterium]|nr:FeoB-associated Cys-rich membrane protein [Oscillospiraceae bacterium]